jgi:hypothetical protein
LLFQYLFVCHETPYLVMKPVSQTAVFVNSKFGVLNALELGLSSVKDRYGSRTYPREHTAMNLI